MKMKVGDYIIDVYGNEGTIVNVFHDYVRLNNGLHVYKTAIEEINPF